MCHPFHRIIAHSQSQAVTTDVTSHASQALSTQSRRGWLATLLAAATAGVATLKGKSATALQHESYAAPPGMVTTQALGEEGGGGFPAPGPPPGSGPVTTFALGEEGGSYRPPSGPITTQALGEEGGGYVPPYPGRPTTYALGEEGSGYYYRRRPSYYYRRVPPPPRRVTTFALGEEGGGY